MKFKAAVKSKLDGRQIIEMEYDTKKEFISDLRANGYQVNEMKVKKSEVFDYIMDHTNCNKWDWKENN